MKCQYCGQEKPNKNSLSNHQIRCKQNQARIAPWNAGLTKETDEKVAATSSRLTGVKRPEISRMFKGRASTSPGKSLDPIKEQNRRDAISRAAKSRGLGGYVKGSGRGKKGWCRGFFCDSSWELAFVLYHTDHSNDIKRCTTPRTYEFNGTVKRYFPDFVVNGVTYEIKGYRTAQWEAKQVANPDVVPLFEMDLKPILAYVVDKYGKNYISMYQGR